MDADLWNAVQKFVPGAALEIREIDLAEDTQKQ